MYDNVGTEVAAVPLTARVKTVTLQRSHELRLKQQARAYTALHQVLCVCITAVSLVFL